MSFQTSSQTSTTTNTGTTNDIIPTATLSGTPSSTSSASSLNVTVSGAGVAKYTYYVGSGSNCNNASYSTQKDVSLKITNSISSYTSGTMVLGVKGISSAGTSQSVPTIFTWTK